MFTCLQTVAVAHLYTYVTLRGSAWSICCKFFRVTTSLLPVSLLDTSRCRRKGRQEPPSPVCTLAPPTDERTYTVVITLLCSVCVVVLGAVTVVSIGREL